MITRRIVACASALALAVPAVASAHVALDPPVATTAHVVHGDTKYDLVAPAGKSAGRTVVVATKQHGPVAASSDDATNGWRIAAVAEAGLLAAIALAGATLVGRTRPRRGAAA